MQRRIIVGSLILITGGLLTLMRHAEKKQFAEPPLAEVATDQGTTQPLPISTGPAINTTSTSVLAEASEPQPPGPDEPAVIHAPKSSVPSLGDDVVVAPEIAPVQHIQEWDPKQLDFDGVEVHLRDAQKKWRRAPRKQTESRD